MSHEYVPEIAVDRDGNEHVVQGWQDDFYGGKLGFWLFMLTEVMMFGGMFLALAYYNALHPQDYIDASASLNRVLGGTNTVILLVSALTMGLGLLKMRVGDVKGAKLMIWATIILAAIFLILGTEGGFAGVMDISSQYHKMKVFDFAFDFTEATIWVILIGGLANNLISYSSDQAVIQRYLTTKDEKSASKGILLNGVMSVFVLLLFYFLNDGR